MKKAKILIVHNYYQISGGEDSVVKNESDMLKENGHEVVLYTRHNSEIKLRGILGKLVLPLETIFSIKTYREVKKIIKKENIDIVHVHNTLPLVSLSVYYAAKRCKVPVVQTIHNFRFVCPNGLFLRKNKACEKCVSCGLKESIKYKCYKNSLWATLTLVVTLKFHKLVGTFKKVDAYIALTEFSKGKFIQMIAAEKIYVKPNFLSSDLKQLNRYDIKDYYVFIGRLEEIKGIEFLVTTWKNVNDSELCIIGDGPQKANIQKIIQEKNIQNIKLKGFLNKEEVLKYISNSKAVIVPSICYEGFPMVIAESFSRGVPVLASRIGNLSFIIKDNYNGFLFDIGNKEEFLLKIKSLSDLNTNRILGENAFDDFKNKFNHKVNYKQLINIYNKCD